MENVSTAIIARRDSRLFSGNLLTIVLIALALVAPFFVYPVFLMKALCFALFACAFNLLIGYVGLLSFGHAAFLGSAGYATAHAAKVWGLTPELAIAFGTAVAAVLGLLIGALTIRSRGIYFANITLAFAQMIYFFCVQATFTGGEGGIQPVPRAVSLGYKPEHYKLLACVRCGICAGLAGSSDSVVVQLASLTDVHWSML